MSLILNRGIPLCCWIPKNGIWPFKMYEKWSPDYAIANNEWDGRRADHQRHTNLLRHKYNIIFYPIKHLFFLDKDKNTLIRLNWCDGLNFAWVGVSIVCISFMKINRFQQCDIHCALSVLYWHLSLTQWIDKYQWIMEKNPSSQTKTVPRL